ncbi:SNF2 family N-terminal domain protein [Bacteriovorax sp. BSW11_IV]|uniref:DEAD/DEAH box helicase n=1 Tax=Bacteriovorax sp. BSW11_IV TaxID=1353529 RepID=UPI00038A018C|nr:DEAD/DEAH box helicase [Bacteriovorax sp. BSW11_IV]EQC45793.1 SNF2 family N-terminal domain protein [Bacteriovorax sp. BSW11_IV]
MTTPSNQLPQSIVDLSENYFSKPTVQKALRYIRSSKVSISFTKGSPETYFITSGIVRDDRSHECKVVFKSRLVGTEEPPLTSNCDCFEWQEKGICEHTCALYICYLLQIEHEKFVENNPDTPLPPIALSSAVGVTVSEYGTIIAGTHQLEGANPNMSYSAFQYLLHDKKVVNFPTPEKFEGKLVINIATSTRFQDEELEIAENPILKFSYIDQDGQHFQEISIFENLYIFNWKNGKAINLGGNLRALVQKIRYSYNKLSINELIKFIKSIDKDEEALIKIDGTELKDIASVEPQCRITLNQGERNGLVEFKLVFFDKNENLVYPPNFLTSFTFLGGDLTSFKKKKDAYTFIEQLTDSFTIDSENYKRTLLTSSKREQWLDLINYMKETKETLVYDHKTKEICHYDNYVLIKILCSLYQNFGEMFFRYADYMKDRKELVFQIAKSNLFTGLNEFYKSLAIHGITIFYDRHEIANWSSRIRFERRLSSNQWFDLELNVDNEDLYVIENADLDNNIALTKKGLVLLTNEQKDLLKFMKKYTKYESTEENVTETGIKKFVLPFNRARIFELFELRRLGIDGALTKEELDLCDRLQTLDKMPEYEVPENLQGILRPYQKTGYNWLRFLYENKLGACLADDMGLGKTLQTITFVKSVYHKVNRVMIACPVSILLNWEQEIKKFSDMDLYIYHGGERNFPDDTKIILTSYGVLKREIDGAFAGKEFDILILDEVQHLKNIRSLGAYAARKIKSDFRVCLTGTPVENDLAEFYNILDLAIPGVWGDLQFIRTTSTQKSRLVARKTASPFILRRTKGQVLTELPPKIENNVYLNFNDGEKDFYETTLSNIRKRIQTSPSKKKYGEILKGLLELRQSCLWQNHNSMQSIHYKHLESTKIEFLLEQLEQIIEEGHQAIVFSQFTTYLDIIESAIRDKHWKNSRIDGTQSIKKRQTQVEEFQAGKTSVFLISLKAGGVGLNLTAASYVFIMDPWWNPAVESQAIDRAHRIGQKNNLTVYRPLIKNSVEEKVLKLQEMKKELFNELLPDNDESLFTGKLSMKDFEDLFN